MSAYERLEADEARLRGMVKSLYRWIREIDREYSLPLTDYLYNQGYEPDERAIELANIICPPEPEEDEE